MASPCCAATPTIVTATDGWRNRQGSPVMSNAGRRIRLVLLWLALVLISTGGGVAHAGSENAAQLTIRPSEGTSNYFSLEMEPGEHRAVEVELGNAGNERTSAQTYAANVYTLINGGFGVALAGEKPSGTTKWLKYRSEIFELDPWETVTRSVSIDIPKKVEPGEYITSLVIQNADPVKGTGGIALNQVFRQAIAVAIDVPGPRTPGLAIGAASYQSDGSSASVLVGVENTGNVRVRPTGRLSVRDSAGSTVLNTEVKMLAFYARSTTTIEIGLSELLPAGEYTVALVLKDKETKVSAEAASLPLEVAYEREAATPMAQVPAISLESVSINELRDVATSTLQGVELVMAIDNPGSPVANARLTLHVTRDGQKVEDYVLGSSLSFPGGKAEFRQRYLPMAGWTAGTWSFSVTLDVVDPNTGTVTELATAEAENTVTVS